MARNLKGHDAKIEPNFQKRATAQVALYDSRTKTQRGWRARNERLVFVRGFDRFQVPLSIDGIRVHLPADNRLDYGRFLTTNIAEVQIAKGYASVLDGPGAMGGAINLVTRRPTKALDVDVRSTVNFDRDAGYAGYSTSARIGTRQDK